MRELISLFKNCERIPVNYIRQPIGKKELKIWENKFNK